MYVASTGMNLCCKHVPRAMSRFDESRGLKSVGTASKGSQAAGNHSEQTDHGHPKGGSTSTADSATADSNSAENLSALAGAILQQVFWKQSLNGILVLPLSPFSGR